jgi:ABC-type branched-subunit amino acid transport system substrate-binding protein
VLGTIVIGVALSLLAAACGDDDDGSAGSASTASSSPSGASGTTSATSATSASSGGTGGAAAATYPQDVGTAADLRGKVGSGLTRGVTATEITVGCITTKQFYPGYDQGAQARFERANREGLNGRKIKMLSCEDDGGDPTTMQNAVRSMVQQDDVFALIENSNAFLPATSDFLGDNEVPFTGAGYVPGFCGTRWGFGYNGCLIGTSGADLVPHPYDNASLVDAPLKAGNLTAADAKVAILGNDNDASRAGNAQFKSLFEKRGAKVVYEESSVPASGTVDYTPFIQAIKSSGANLVVLDTTFADIGPMTGGLTAAGFTGPIVNFVAYQPGLLEQSPDLAKALEGAYINAQTEPQETQSPYVQQVQQDLQAISAPTDIKFGTALGYEHANLLVQLLQAAGPTLDTKTFDSAANGGGFTYKPGHPGGAGDLPYPTGHFVAAPCAAMVKVSQGKYTVSVPFSCYDLVAAG